MYSGYLEEVASNWLADLLEKIPVILKIILQYLRLPVADSSDDCSAVSPARVLQSVIILFYNTVFQFGFMFYQITEFLYLLARILALSIMVLYFASFLCEV